MPVLPIENAPSDAMAWVVVYAHTAYPKDEPKRDELLATYLTELLTKMPETRPTLDKFAADNPWFLPALHRAAKPDKVLKVAADELVSGWACGEVLTLMLSAAVHHPDLDVTPTKTIWAMSKFHSGGKSQTGATVSASIRYIWKAWGKFQAAAHFHAVRRVWKAHFGDLGYLKLEAFREYLAVAESIRRQAVSRRFLSQDKTWRVPESFSLPEIRYTPGELTPEMLDLFRSFKPEHSRH
jgi:hypothetical protein